MVGRWQAEGPGGKVEVDCQWAPEKAFLLREIRTIDSDEFVDHVSQRIGLDPATQRFRSWSFDTSGGSAEATWEPNGSSWVVSSHGSADDGEATSARTVYSEIGPDAYALKSTEGHYGVTDAPVAELRFTRIKQDSTSAPEAASTGTAADDGRAKILSSPEWREAQRAFEQWLSIQKTYTAAEVEEMRSGLRSRIDKMSVAELQSFLADSREKLRILLGEDAQQARLWLAQRLAVEVNLTPEQIRQHRPDVVNKTPAQLEKWLAQWRQQRDQTQQAQARVRRRPQSSSDRDRLANATQGASPRGELEPSQRPHDERGWFLRGAGGGAGMNNGAWTHQPRPRPNYGLLLLGL